MKRAKHVQSRHPLDPSGDLLSDQIEALRDIIPQAFTEGKIDFDNLRALLGQAVDTRPERYSFTWAGKQQAIRLAQTPSRATLLPAPSQSVDFDTTQNLFLEGDNLEVLKLLRRSYNSAVKMIYIDPPYNTGNDFVYPDDFSDALENYLRITGQTDAQGNLRTSNPETSGRYHSAWLSMMYPRLVLARQLLAADGAICVSIGDEELADLRLLMNVVFGEENHRNTIAVRRFDKNLNRQFMESGLKSMAIGFEYVLIYAKSERFEMNPVFREANAERQATGYWKGFHNAADRPTMRYPLLGITPESGQWKWQKKVADEAVANYEEYRDRYQDKMSLETYWEMTGKTKKFIRRNPHGKGMNQGVEHWIPPSTGILRTSNWTDLLASEASQSGTPFDSPKSVDLLRNLVHMCCLEDDTVLDFFAGSATTAQAIVELNRQDSGSRRFIMVQLPEPTPDDSDARKAGFHTVADIGIERIRRVIARMKEADNGTLGLSTRETPEDLGFRVFKLGASNLRQWDAPSQDSDEAYLRQLEGVTRRNGQNRTLGANWSGSSLRRRRETVR